LPDPCCQGSSDADRRLFRAVKQNLAARTLQGRRISALSGSVSRWQTRLSDGKLTFTFQERGAPKEHFRKKTVISVSGSIQKGKLSVRIC